LGGQKRRRMVMALLVGEGKEASFHEHAESS